MNWTPEKEALWQERIRRGNQCPLKQGSGRGEHYYTEIVKKHFWSFSTPACRCGWTIDDAFAVEKWYFRECDRRGL